MLCQLYLHINFKIMRLEIFISKIHRATVTEAELFYEGSLTIDKTLMDAANILPWEKVQVVNINNGERLETYVLEGESNSGVICLNGPAARLGFKGDEVIIITYAMMEPEEAAGFVPRVVFVDKNNKIKSITG